MVPGNEADLLLYVEYIQMLQFVMFQTTSHHYHVTAIREKEKDACCAASRLMPLLLPAWCAADLPACYSRIHHPDCPYNPEMKEAVRHEREIVVAVVADA